MDRKEAVLNLYWVRMDDLSRLCFFAAVAIGILGIGAIAIGSPSNPLIVEGWCVVGCALLLEASVVRPLHSLAKDGCDRIWPVCALSALALVAFIVAFYWAYYCFAGNLQAGSASSPLAKILDLPPVAGAIWAASTGWYVHFQLTGRGHRVAHAMSMVMGTRTNAEFLKRHNLLRQVLPSKDAINDVPRQMFEKTALKDAQERFATAKEALEGLSLDASGRDDALKAKTEAAATLKLARAVDALQYTLNYYEFMAAGIRFGDLDERLFYQTISPAVIALCERAEPYLKWVNSPAEGQQQLAFEYLKPLVKKWKKMSDQDEADAAAEVAKNRANNGA